MKEGTEGTKKKDTNNCSQQKQLDFNEQQIELLEMINAVYKMKNSVGG